MTDFSGRRAALVDSLRRRGIRSAAVLAAIGAVPRERFVDAAFAANAYDDAPLPIGEGQTVSQPWIVAAMAEAAEIGRGDAVLEVGAGCGYAAAVLARLGARVCAMERLPGLASQARANTATAGADGVDLRVGDGSAGWPDAAARFDAIVVSAAGPHVPPALRRQLAAGGRLVMPVGTRARQRLLRVRRVGDDAFDTERLSEVRFVPLVGTEGWPDGGDPG
ncbi:MAG: protein-L-isoaspartate(D-aspartate) O-methyltransferase [Comamonadaceae bacterium]|nr:protein-L-isoaspartate(D-aspartate) O-methyltransferase [Comamonadaceae bacterium]